MAQLNDIQLQIIQLVLAAALGDLKATLQIEQIMQAALQGNLLAILVAQMILQVIQAMQQLGGQLKVMARYGTKLRYLQRLRGICPEGEELVFFEKGGKMCKACLKKAVMQKGGNTTNKTKVAKKDIDAATYQKLPKHTQDDLDMHMERYAVSHNNNGSYNTSHKPTSLDSTTIDRKKMSAEMRKKYLEKKACGSKIKKKELSKHLNGAVITLNRKLPEIIINGHWPNMTYKYEELEPSTPYDVRHHLVWDDSKKSLSRFFNSAGSPLFGTFIQNGEELDDLNNIKKLKELWVRMLNNPRLKNRKDPHLKYSLNSFGIEENEID